MEYFAYWNGEQVVAILNAIAGIMGSGSFLGLVKVAGVFGLLAAVIGAMFRQKFADAWNFFLVFTLIYMGLMVPKVTVNVIDVRGGTATPVANVPLGIGVFASEMSHIGKWLTESYETAFSPVEESARFARFGMLGPQRLMNAALTASLDVPVVRSNMATFMRDCVIPELIDRPRTVAEFTASSNVWNSIGATGWLNPGRITMIQQPAVGSPPTSIVRGTAELVATPVNCPDAHSLLAGQLDIAANVAINAIAPKVLPANSGYSQTATEGALSAAGTYIKARIEGSNALLTGAAATAEQLIKQRAAVDALGHGIDSANPMAASIGQAVGIGNLSSAINYRSMAQIAQDALPKLRNAIEMLTVAAFPMIGILLLVAGLQALPLFKGYLVMLLWTQLWAPLYAVVNFMMISSDTSPYTALIQAYGAQSIPAMSLMTQLGASSQDTAGMLTLLVPAIAFALAKGGEVAMSSMASSMLAPATSAAQSSGTQLAQGNTSLGNVSWGNFQEGNTSRGNFTAGQVRDGSNIDTSSGTVRGETGARGNLGPFGSVTRDGQGGEVWNVPASRAGAVSSAVTGASTLGNTRSSATGASAQQAREAQAMKELGSALRDATSAQSDRGFTQQFMAAWEGRQQTEAGRRYEAGQLVKSAESLEAAAQAAESVRMTTGVQGGAHLGANLGKSAAGQGASQTQAPGTAGAPAGAPAGPVSGAGAGGPVAASAPPSVGIPAPGSAQSNIPPSMRGQTAPTRPTIDPNSPEARIPPSMRGPTAAPGTAVAATPDPAALRAQAAEKRSAAAKLLEGLPVSGIVQAGANGGMGFDASTQIAESARRAASGEASESDRQVLAAAMTAARAMRYDSADRSTQAKGARLEQALNNAMTSRSGESATAAQTQRAEDGRTEGRSNEVRSSRGLDHLLADQARAMYPQQYTGALGDYNLARDMHDGHPRILAARDVLDKGEEGRLGSSHPSGEALHHPQSPAAVYSGGAGQVEALTQRSEGAVRAHDTEGRARVAATGPDVSPSSVAGPQGLPAQVNSEIAAGQQSVADKGEMASTRAGLAAFAAQTFADQRNSAAEPLKLALRSMGGGLGYDSPGEQIQGLAPHLSTEGRQFFAGLQQQQLAQGGVSSMSEGQRELAQGYIKEAAEAYKEGQPKKDEPPSSGLGA